MAELLKNLYDEKYIDLLVNCISNNYKDFDKNSFKKAIFDDTWDNLELKQRMRHITNNLYHFLPKNYKKTIDILKNTYKNIKENNDKNEALQNMIFQDFVGLYGLDDFETSMDALAFFTIDSSSEFAIREFIIKDEDKTMNQMLLWAKDHNFHIRRLASEGCRPRLPWARALPKFKKDPTKVLEVLNLLQDDEVDYVKKSVANNINDISKDHPQIVINIVKNWQNQSKHKDWILKHGSRTLLKAGDTKILELFGYKEIKDLIIKDFNCDESLYIGENLEFSFELISKNIINNVRIEYSIDFLRQNNRYNKKVFFIADKFFGSKNIKISKKNSFKLINTRKYYKGIQVLNIIVNGIVIISKEFNLMEITNG